MAFRWLKSIMPRGLYGRAALILLLPILVTQLVVSVLFVQRHFDGVTRQMVGNVSQEIRFVLGEIEAARDREDAQSRVRRIVGPLDISARFVPPDLPREPSRKTALDFSGAIVIRELRRTVPQVVSVDLASNPRVVDVRLQSRFGDVSMVFARTRVSASNPHQLLVFMIFTAAVMTFIAFLYLRNQLRPIRRLARAAEAFGKGRTVPYSPSGAVEVRSAGQAFLDMRRRINRHIEQRTLMLSGVSHDLRTPITRLKLGLSMLPQDEDTRAMMGDVAEMERMIEEFLAFARGNSGEAMERMDPVALCREIAADCARSGRDLELVLPQGVEGPVSIVARPTALRRALENLIGNAFRHGTHVRLTCLLKPRIAAFVVEDDGPGIAEHERELALRPFARLDQARNRNDGSGVGLGLAIAADIAFSHGGSLILNTSHDLKGLKAIFEIPR